MPPSSSKKNHTSTKDRSRVTQQHHQHHKHQINMIIPNQTKKKNISIGSKNQATRAGSQIAGKFPNSCKKYKLTTREGRGQPPTVPTANMHHCKGIKPTDRGTEQGLF